VGDGYRLIRSHNSPMILFICENKGLKCPSGLK
jgi:hypothetical protein